MGKRSYRQNCVLAHAADIVGERWSVLLVRELLIRPCRYKQLLRYLRGIGTNLLATRLKEMEEQGLIEKQEDPNGAYFYHLTPMGRAIEPAIANLIRWGFRHANGNQEGYLSFPHWDILPLKALYNPAAAPKSPVTIVFEWPEESVWVRVSYNSPMVYEFKFPDSSDLVLREPISALLEIDPSTFPDKESQKLEAFLASFNSPV